MTTKTAFPIQPIIAPDFGRPPELFTADPEAAPGFQGNAPWRLSAGNKIATNTYLNALFPHVWVNFTDIGNIGVSCDVEGSVQIEVIWVDENEAETILVNETSGETGPRQITVWAGLSPIQNGRIYLRLTALGDVAINDLAWVTDCAPKHQPSLSVGLCTFNREPELAATLAALSSQRVRTPEIKTVYVVNQGPEFSNQSILDEIDKPGIALIEQPNLGGCGGFTRSMFEATQAKDETTHHLLMDDDIVLDPRLLDKVVHFLRYAHQTLAVGGQMLEIENPTLLYEAGGKVHHRNFVEPIGKNLDIGVPKALQIFTKTPDIDYNAWWFCVVPVASIRAAGLPPPLFIRGDDIEYGFRIKANGFDTIPLPGCPVWHESFSHKSSDWLNYYVLRNRLLFSIIYPEATKRPDSIFLFGFLMTLILANRYRAASLALRAIQDATNDPNETLRLNSAVKHQEINALVKSLPSPASVDAANVEHAKSAHLKKLNTSIPAMIGMIVCGFVMLHLTRLNPWKRSVKFSMMPEVSAVNGRDYYAAVNKAQTQFLFYPTSLRKHWSLTFKTIALCCRYSFVSNEKLAMIRNNLETLRHPDHWKKAFNAPRD